MLIWSHQQVIFWEGVLKECSFPRGQLQDKICWTWTRLQDLLTLALASHAVASSTLGNCNNGSELLKLILVAALYF